MRPNPLTCAIPLLLVLAGCGGGGSGGGNDTGGTPGPSGPTEPAAITVSYSGNSQPAVLDKTNAADYAATAVSARALQVILEQLWIDIVGVSGNVSETVSGNTGTATIAGNISAGTGWLEVTFSNYSESGPSVDGRMIQRIERGTTAAGFIFSPAGAGQLEFDDLTISVSGAQIQFRGSLAFSGDNSRNVDFDLLVTDPATGESVYYSDFSIDYSSIRFNGGDIWAEELSGTIYESNLGYVAVSSLEPFGELEAFEHIGYVISRGHGRIRLEGNGGAVEFSALSRTWAALEIDTDDDGALDESLRISWGALAGLAEMTGSVRSGPIANAGNWVSADVGDTALVHALYSHDDDGDWLSYEWQIVAKPIDSTLVLADAAAPTQSIVPDVAGQYLFAVTASDGAEATRTTIEVSARAPVSNPRNGRVTNGAVEISLPLEIGAPILLDGRPAMNRPYVDGFSSWWVDGEGNWVLTERDSPAEQEMVTDTNGLNVAQYQESSALGRDGEVRFMVGPDLPLVDIQYLGYSAGRTVALADYDGDGLDDLMFGVAAFPNTGFHIVRNLGNGDWEAGDFIEGPFGEVAVGDLNDDGRLDIALSGDDGVYVSYQQADGTPGAMVVVASPDAGCLAEDDGDIGVGDIDGDNRDDLFAVITCTGSLYVWRQDGSGNLQPPTHELASEYIRFGHFADVNDDGRMDALISSIESAPNPARVAIALAQPDGTLAISERFDTPYSNAAASILVEDVTNDGLRDVILAGSSNLVVLERQLDGTTQQFVAQSLSSSTGLYASLDVTDLDDDGDMDIVFCDWRGYFFVMARLNGAAYEELQFGRCDNGLNGLSNSYVIGDFNADGADDIIFAGAGGSSAPPGDALMHVLFGDMPTYAVPAN